MKLRMRWTGGHTEFLEETLKDRDELENQSIGGRIILK
jgi:hypothetical protein